MSFVDRSSAGGIELQEFRLVETSADEKHMAFTLQMDWAREDTRSREETRTAKKRGAASSRCVGGTRGPGACSSGGMSGMTMP